MPSLESPAKRRAKTSSGTQMYLWALPILVGALFYLGLELLRPELLLVGNITIDLVDDTTPTGGAVSYAAVTALALGVKACIVTVAGPDADLSVFDGHELHVIPADSTLTFEHTYTWFGNQRKLRVTANPNVTVRWEDVPWRCRLARTILLGPLTLHDLDAGSFVKPAGGSWWQRLAWPDQRVGLMAQGFQRKLVEGGRVKALELPSEQLLAGLGSNVYLFLSDVETDSWPAGTLQQLANRTAAFLVTRGAEGADCYSAGTQIHVPPTEVTEVLDSNGAGDTFGTSYMIALSRGHTDPGTFASWAASRAVMQPQACKPQCAAGHMLREGGRPWSTWDHWQAAAGRRMPAWIVRGALGDGARTLCMLWERAADAASARLRVLVDAAAAAADVVLTSLLKP